MKANLNNNEYLTDVLSEPHFDDERTLLSAQPVVPLRKPRVNERLGKRGAFGLAIFCSLVVGFLSATVIYRQRTQKAPAEVVGSAIPGAEGKTADQPEATPATLADTAIDAGAGNTSEPEAVKAEPEKSNVAVHQPRKVALTAIKPPQSVRPVTRKPKADRETRPEVTVRRPKADGAGRIREIFEGSRRP